MQPTKIPDARAPNRQMLPVGWVRVVLKTPEVRTTQSRAIHGPRGAQEDCHTNHHRCAGGEAATRTGRRSSRPPSMRAAVGIRSRFPDRSSNPSQSTNSRKRASKSWPGMA